jgi:hypothetical protein
MPDGVTEVWVQWYYKYSSNFRYHGSGDKQMYFNPSNVQGTIVYGSYPNGEMDMEPQGGSHAGQTVWTYPPNQGASVGGDSHWYLVPGTWHKYKAYYKGHTGGNMNGLYKMWIDDILVSDWSNVWYGGGDNYTFAGGSNLRWDVIWGGMGQTLDRVQYLSFSDLYIGSTDPGGTTTDVQPPYVYNASPTEGSTGNDNTNRAVSVVVADAGGGLVTRSSVSMQINVNGGSWTTYSYGSGLAFSPNTATFTSATITRTMGADWPAGATIGVRVNATDNNGNVMQQKSYTFETSSASTRTYTTGFSATENPISEGGNWIPGSVVGLLPTDIKTSLGDAKGTLTTHYCNDSIAILTPPWSADQSAEGTIWADGRSSSGPSGWGDDCTREVELLLRFNIAANTAQGYEVYFSSRTVAGGWGPYIGVTRWDQTGYLTCDPAGPGQGISQHGGIMLGKPGIDDYCEANPSKCMVSTNDVVKATMIGNVIRIYKNDELLYSLTDDHFTSGNPGIGMYMNDACAEISGYHADDFGYHRSFTAESLGADTPLHITTTSLNNGTVSVAYSDYLSATAGASPYMWDNVGMLPPGLTLGVDGHISGTPTLLGTYSFTAEVTDSNAATDTASLSIYVAPWYPGDSTTVTGKDAIYTMINSGSTGTNYYGTMEVYQWPAGVVANRILLQDNTAKGLPDNILITAATLRLHTSDWEGPGGTVPMRVRAYNVTGTIPVLSTVTWVSWAGTLSAALSTAEVPLSTGWVSWNILSSAQAAKAGNATMTLALDGGPDGATDTNRIFDSIEVVITYTQLACENCPSISAPGKMRVSKARFKTFR